MPVLSYNITWYWFVYNFPYGVNIHTAVPSVESCVFGTWLSSGLDYDRHTRHFVSYENKHCRTKWGSSKYFPEWEKNIKSYSMHSEWNRIQELLYDISVRFVAAYRCASRCWKFDILSSALDRAVTRHQRPLCLAVADRQAVNLHREHQSWLADGGAQTHNLPTTSPTWHLLQYKRSEWIAYHETALSPYLLQILSDELQTSKFTLC